MKDYQGDYESSYLNQMTQRALAIVRATALFCLTLLLIGGAFLYFSFYNERFNIVGYEEGVYVFDRSDLNLSHCTNTGKCFTMAMKKSEDAPPETPVMAPPPAPTSAPTNAIPVCVPQMIPTSQGMMLTSPQSPLALTSPATQSAVLGSGVVPSAVQQQMNMAATPQQPAQLPTAPSNSAVGGSLFQPMPTPQWNPVAMPAAPVIAQPVTPPSPAPVMAPPAAPSPSLSAPTAAFPVMPPQQAPLTVPQPPLPASTPPSPSPLGIPSTMPSPNAPLPNIPAPGAAIASAIAPGTGILGTGDNAVVAAPADNENPSSVDNVGMPTTPAEAEA